MEYLTSAPGNKEENLNTTERPTVKGSTASLHSHCTSTRLETMTEWLCVGVRRQTSEGMGTSSDIHTERQEDKES